MNREEWMYLGPMKAQFLEGMSNFGVGLVKTKGNCIGFVTTIV